MKFWESDLGYHRGCEEGAIGWQPTSIFDATQTAADRICHAFCLEPDCDSPIEVILGAAILTVFNRNNRPIRICHQNEIGNRNCTVLVPQFLWSFYASDFAIFPIRGRFVLIECDGRDFHSSPAQRQHDLKKDSAANQLGYWTMRFTGSEINADADSCADRILRATS